jgi:hypothetical protein
MQEGDFNITEKFPAGWDEAEETRDGRTKSHSIETQKQKEKKKERKAEIILWTELLWWSDWTGGSADRCGSFVQFVAFCDPIPSSSSAFKLSVTVSINPLPWVCVYSIYSLRDNREYIEEISKSWDKKRIGKNPNEIIYQTRTIALSFDVSICVFFTKI